MTWQLTGTVPSLSAEVNVAPHREVPSRDVALEIEPLGGTRSDRRPTESQPVPAVWVAVWLQFWNAPNPPDIPGGSVRWPCWGST